MTLVREDEKGLYIKAGGYFARPGIVSPYDLHFDMSDGGLKAGDKVKALHWAQSTFTKITLSDGRKLLWPHDEEMNKEYYDKVMKKYT